MSFDRVSKPDKAAAPTRKCVRYALGLLAMLASVLPAPAGPVMTFSAGAYVVPETISQAPDSFGNFGGYYIIPDGNSTQPGGHVWAVAPTGGAPVSLATNGDFGPRGGVFLPSNWGANAGNFLEVGHGTDAQVSAAPVFIVSSNGVVTPFSNLTVNGGQPLIAPSTFGQYGGQVLIPNYNTQTLVGSITALAPGGSSSTLATGGSVPLGAGGAVFAPSSFGSVGGTLLVDGLASNQIVSVRADGTVTPFATVPLKNGQPSPFQMAFAPAGFLPGEGPLLFVSVRGSTLGGGTLGDVLVYNANGVLVSSLRSDLGLTSFDPRGLLFVPDLNDPSRTDLLVSNAEPDILLVPSAAFVTVPEPSTAVLAAVCVGGLGLRAWRQRKA